MSSSSVESSQVHQIREENVALCQKILQQENSIRSLKCKYENAVDDSEEAHHVNKKLDDEIQTLRSTIANQSVKIEDEVSDKIWVADLEKYLLEKKIQIEDIINQNKNYKIEIRNINFKNEKFIIENRNIKNEKENSSVALRAARKEVKENEKNITLKLRL